MEEVFESSGWKQERSKLRCLQHLRESLSIFRRNWYYGLKKHTCNRRDSAATSSGIITSFVNVSRVPQASKQRFSLAYSAFIAEDLRPYNIVAGNGFSKLIRVAIDIGASGGKIQAPDIIPNRKTVASKTKTLAASAREKLIDHLKSNIDDNKCAMTTDMWTDDYRKLSYLTLTVHYADHMFIRIFDRVLCTVHFAETKTGENIHEEIKKIVRQFGFQSLENVIFVTDRGSNMIAALKNDTRLNCVAHMLNAVLSSTFESKNLKNENLDEVNDLLENCRSVVGYFKRSAIMEKLDTALVQFVETPWNSHCSMLRSIEKNYKKLSEVKATLYALSSSIHSSPEWDGTRREWDGTGTGRDGNLYIFDGTEQDGKSNSLTVTEQDGKKI